MAKVLRMTKEASTLLKAYAAFQRQGPIDTEDRVYLSVHAAVVVNPIGAGKQGFAVLILAGCVYSDISARDLLSRRLEKQRIDTGYGL